MHRIGNNILSYIITILTVFAMTTCFSLAPVSSRDAGSVEHHSAAKTMGEFIEAVNHFLDKAGEPALLANTGDVKFSNLRADFQRCFSLFGIICTGIAFNFSYLNAWSKNGSLDYTNPILIKLRI